MKKNIKYIVKCTDQNINFYLSPKTTPCCCINNGDIVKVFVRDCFNNKVKKTHKSYCDLIWEEMNPCTGPIYVNNANIGDVLKITIINISIESKGIVAVDSHYLKSLGLKHKDESIHLRQDNNFLYFSDTVKIPVKPMIGTIGVAPKNKSILTTIPGAYGGNMDCNIITDNSILYLPVFHEGGLLHIGDLHSLMGDGEYTDSGIECAGNVEVKIDVIKKTKMPLPFVETNEIVSTIASDINLQKSAKQCFTMMLQYLTNQKNIPFKDA